MINTFTKYKNRPIRFVEIYHVTGWKVKIYSISVHHEFVTETNLMDAKNKLKEWLAIASKHDLPTYKIATLILHEGKEGVFAIINWWIDENMLQNFVYLKKYNEQEFQLFSQDGICTCVWEMAVWWHERNAWVKHILSKHDRPDFQAYLNDQLNIGI
jgi:hypothetical protein